MTYENVNKLVGTGLMTLLATDFAKLQRFNNN